MCVKQNSVSKLRFSALLFIVVLCISQSIPVLATASQTSAVTLMMSGSIANGNDNIPPGLTLKYSTDFEDITKVSESQLSLPFSHDFGRGNDPTGARMWMEDGSQEANSPTPYSGSRSIGMETTTSDRIEFNIYEIQNLAGQEYYMSIWLYLPVGWQIPQSHWCSLGQAFQRITDPWIPREETLVTNWDGITKVEIGYSPDPYDKIILATKTDYLPPVGRWFKYEYHVVLHPTLGKLKIWIDGNLMCDVSNLQTTGSIGQSMLVDPAKIYGGEGIGTRRLWFDNLVIYGLP